MPMTADFVAACSEECDFCIEASRVPCSTKLISVNYGQMKTDLLGRGSDTEPVAVSTLILDDPPLDCMIQQVRRVTSAFRSHFC